MESKRRKWPALLTLGGATISILIAVFLIPPAISDRDYANASLTLFGVGFALLILTAILAIGLQTSPDRTIPSAAGAHPFWRIATTLVWIIAGLHILFLAAFALLALSAGALDDRDEAMDILIPQAVTALVLIGTLWFFVPWRVPPEATLLRRLGFIAPITIITLFWYWMVYLR